MFNLVKVVWCLVGANFDTAPAASKNSLTPWILYQQSCALYKFALVILQESLFELFGLKVIHI